MNITRNASAVVILLSLLTVGLPVSGQEPGHEDETEEEPFHPHHTVAVAIGHSLVREGVVENGKRWLNLPSWAIDYSYYFHRRWGIGLHTDIIPESFVVTRHFGERKIETIERDLPVAPAIMAIFTPGRRRHLGLLFGAGVEIASEESFFLNRVGLEYGLELPKNWELGFHLTYDIKWDAYDSIGIALGIAKVFGMPKKMHQE